MAKLERASYQLILKKYQARKMENVRLSQSTLLMLKAIQNNTKLYQFPILTTDAPSPVPVEIRLNINDEFTSYEVGYYLQGFGVDSANPTNSDHDMYWTYAPMEQNSLVGVLNFAWTGQLNILVNNINRLTNWDMLKHKVVPRTQYQNSSTGIPSATQPSINYSKDGMCEMQPMITFSGAKKNDISISMAENIISSLTFNYSPVSGTLTYTVINVCLVFRGMLAQNAAKFQ